MGDKYAAIAAEMALSILMKTFPRRSLLSINGDTTE
jgi:hypothetical protein